jgi:drug/metabolite transporter (DMT)-like permease
MLKGLFFQLIASAFFALMSACVYAAHLTAPDSGSLHISFVRAAVNLIVIVLPICLISRDWKMLWGDGRWSLWWRGLFGGTSLMLSFAGTQAIGIAESSFLHSSNAFFVAALAPAMLGQKNPATIWFILLTSLFGMYLLMQPRFDDLHHLGRAASLASGLAGALAYLMIARAGKTNHPTTIIFYFSLVACLLHLVLLPFDHTPWPSNAKYWWLAIGAGIFATAAQYFMTRAYQQAPAVLSAIVGYASPVFSLILGIMLFGRVPDHQALVGSAVIIGCGVVLPLIQARKIRESTVEVVA